MRVLVCGGRNYADYAHVEEIMDALRAERGITHVIHGAARGADMLAFAWAVKRLGAENVTGYPADWLRFGMKAGPWRNQQMIDEGKPDLVVAFPGGKGTADMVRRARQANIETIEVATTP